VKGETLSNPSEAQAEAGNYPKATERDFGHDISLETRKGEMRRGKNPDGTPWEVEHPTDYGHFLRTRGADNEPIDVHRGDSGDKHFVLDQRNPETGKFDEHKVFTNFKDMDEVRDAYFKAHSDGKGPDRLHDITEVSREELTPWLKGHGKSTKKPYGAPTAKEKGEPKVVTATVKALRESANPEHAKIADAIEALPPEQRVVRAAQANAMLNSRTGSIPEAPKSLRIRPKAPTLKVGDTEVSGRTLADVAKKKASLDAVTSAYEKHPPVEGETREQLVTRLQDAMIHAEKTLGGDPLAYKPQVKPKEWMWLRDARKFVTGSKTQAQADKFITNEKLLRSGNPEDVALVRGTNRIEADIANSRRSGDEAIADAENKQAARFDVPHEEAESMVEPEPIKSAADIKKPTGKTLDLTKPEDAKTAAIDTDKISRNVIAAADKRKAEAAALAGKKSVAPANVEAEGAASGVRKIKVSDPEEIKRIMEAANKAAAKGKGMDALPPEKDTNPQPRKIDDLFDKFMRDENGSVNIQRLSNDYKTKVRVPLRNWIESMFGTPKGESSTKIDSILAKSVSTEDSLNAERAAAFDRNYYKWTEGATPKEQMTYQRVLEKAGNKPHAEFVDALKDAGIPEEKAKWMADEAPEHRAILDKLWLEDQKHGADHDYVANYVPHIFEDTKGAQDFIEARIKNLGPTWYQKERTFDLIEEAMKAGFKPKFSNPIDVINARWAASIKSNMLVAAARGLQEHGFAFPTKDLPDSLKRLWTMKRTLPDGQQWTFAPGAENLWRNSMEAEGLNELKGPIGSTYRAWMQAKRVFAPIQLAFSALRTAHRGKHSPGAGADPRDPHDRQ